MLIGYSTWFWTICKWSKRKFVRALGEYHRVSENFPTKLSSRSGSVANQRQNNNSRINSSNSSSGSEYKQSVDFFSRSLLLFLCAFFKFCPAHIKRRNGIKQFILFACTIYQTKKFRDGANKRTHKSQRNKTNRKFAIVLLDLYEFSERWKLTPT